MLKKALRLPVATSFKNAKTLHTDLLLIKYQKNNLTISRFGFVVSKKISKSAVARNRIKRVIRRVIEENLDRISPGYDMLLILRNDPGDRQIDKSEILDAIEKKIV